MCVYAHVYFGADHVLVCMLTAVLSEPDSLSPRAATSTATAANVSTNLMERIMIYIYMKSVQNK